MDYKSFFKLCNFTNKTEIEKIKLITFYLLKTKDISSFKTKEIADILLNKGFNKPNTSRLNNKIRNSNSFIYDKMTNEFKLSYIELEYLEQEYPQLTIDSEDITTIDSILPKSLYSNTRGYIEKISKQINASYESNIIDGCAVLMRRLIEILLIISYKNINRDNEIKNNGKYRNLNFIINYTISNNIFSLTKETEDCLHTFRKLGNFSAHRIQYNCRKSEIRNVALDFRAAIEELLHTANLKK